MHHHEGSCNHTLNFIVTLSIFLTGSTLCFFIFPEAISYLGIFCQVESLIIRNNFVFQQYKSWDENNSCRFFQKLNSPFFMLFLFGLEYPQIQNLLGIKSQFLFLLVHPSSYFIKLLVAVPLLPFSLLLTPTNCDPFTKSIFQFVLFSAILPPATYPAPVTQQVLKIFVG